MFPSIGGFNTFISFLPINKIKINLTIPTNGDNSLEIHADRRQITVAQKQRPNNSKYMNCLHFTFELYIFLSRKKKKKGVGKLKQVFVQQMSSRIALNIRALYSIVCESCFQSSRAT